MDKVSQNMVACVVLRHLGVEREIVVLKAYGFNFYIFPPYAKKPFGSVDVHMSWHESGERHATVRINGRQGKAEAEFQKNSIVMTCPPAKLKGVIELYRSGIFLHQWHDFFPIGTNEGQRVLLDSTAEDFRDDFIGIKVYAASPDAEDQIQISTDAGPRFLHVLKQTTPWLAVEVFQQVQPVAPAA